MTIITVVRPFVLDEIPAHSRDTVTSSGRPVVLRAVVLIINAPAKINKKIELALN